MQYTPGTTSLRNPRFDSWHKLATKLAMAIGKAFVRRPRGDTRITPEDKRRYMAHIHFTPQRWLLCHMGLYSFEFNSVTDHQRSRRTVVAIAVAVRHAEVPRG